MAIETYDDIRVGETRHSRPYLIAEDEILSFARQWNPEPFHIDKKAAGSHPIGKLFASGVHLLAICVKLGNEFDPRAEFVAGLGWDEIRFLRPVFPGDLLRLELCCVDKRRSSSQPEKGIITMAMRLFNQMDELILSYSVTAMIICHNETADAR